MSDDTKQLPESTTPARKGKTSKEADRALKKFNAQYVKATQVKGISEFGEFVIGNGTKETGVGFMTYAAASIAKSIENCDNLINQVEDPELKVRLQENKLKSAEAVAKIGKDLAGASDEESNQPERKPGVPVFPANVTVGVQTVVHPPDKPVSS